MVGSSGDIDARLMLEKIGPLVGIGACSSEVNH
jgi:hypothetical protein